MFSPSAGCNIANYIVTSAQQRAGVNQNCRASTPRYYLPRKEDHVAITINNQSGAMDGNRCPKASPIHCNAIPFHRRLHGAPWKTWASRRRPMSFQIAWPQEAYQWILQPMASECRVCPVSFINGVPGAIHIRLLLFANKRFSAEYVSNVSRHVRRQFRQQPAACVTIVISNQSDWTVGGRGKYFEIAPNGQIGLENCHVLLWSLTEIINGSGIQFW